MDLNTQAVELADKAGNLFKGSMLSGLMGMGIGGLLQIVLTVVSIAVGLMAFKNYMLSNEIKRLELAKMQGKNKPVDIKQVM